jgi:hypothetical protein
MIETLESRRSLSASPTVFGDTNGDYAIDLSDLLTVSQNFGTSGDHTKGDFNGDGQVGFDDLLLLTRNFGKQFPTADNTGPTGPLNRLPDGTITIRTDGTVLENFELEGEIRVEARDVVIRNFRLRGTTDFGIRTSASDRSVTIEDGEITGTGRSAVFGNGVTARRLHIHHTLADAFHFSYAGDSSVESSYVHHIGAKVSAHGDAVQIVKGSNFSFRNNRFDMPVDLPVDPSQYPADLVDRYGGLRETHGHNAAFMIKQDSGPISNVVVDGNWLNGGNVTINVDNVHGNPQGLVFVNNLFGNDYRYGEEKLVVDEYVWEGNVDAYTGEIVNV